MAASAATGRDEVLRVEGLRTQYSTPVGVVAAVNDLNFAVRSGERFGLAGESGSGKSSIALSLMRMIHPPGRIVSGRILLDGRDLLTLSDEEMRRTRLADIALVAQGSINSLNPVRRIREQFADGFRDHGVVLAQSELDARVGELLKRVGLPAETAGRFPHELSGGMKQRVCIAMAISLSPKVIIADEPTSALDVVVQRHVMATLEKVQEELGASIILVGHDMGLMAQSVDRLGIMYAGRLVEVAPVDEIFRHPQHPYTQLLIASLPSLERRGGNRGIPGVPPSLRDLPPACAFHVRCPFADPTGCAGLPVPELTEVAPAHWVACHHILRGTGGRAH
jgi:peptide/nickel transport system ATP-binding protein